jgi:hypothetical protein
MRSLCLLLACLLVALWLAPARAQPPSAARRTKELAARKAFAASDWDRALDLFSDLYAETLHPVYLRNIARCHQKKRQPGKAIDAFHDYLAKSKDVSADERREIDGYIAEMQQLEDEQARQAAPPPVVTAPPPPVPVTPLVSSPPPPLAEEPVYRKWWLWTAIGAAVAAGVTAVVLLGRSGSPSKVCPPGVVSCS